MKHGLADLCILSNLPWQPTNPPPPPFLCPVVCGDAAELGNGYQIGLFSTFFGIRIIRAPTEIASQQMAELFAIDCATCLSVRLGLSYITYVGDNTSALQTVLSLRPTLTNPVATRITRRIFNRLLWSPLAFNQVTPQVVCR